MFTDARTFGGAETALLTLLEGLDRTRWQPTLVHHESEEVAPLLEAARDLDVELWSVRPMPDGIAGAARAASFAARLRRRRPDVFHAHLTWPLACKFGLAAAVAARVPVVVATVQCVVDFSVTGWPALEQRALDAGVDRYIAVSRNVERWLCNSFRWRGPKIVVVPNAVSAERFRRPPDPELRAVLSRNESRRVVLALARLVKQKGLPFLLHAANDLRHAQIVVAGDGPDRDELMTLARELEIADVVDFLGFRDDVASLLACSDVVVLPSLYEGLPLSALEAMAAEKPVVATATGGTDEVVVDGVTGLLVPTQDPASLAGALQMLLDDPEARARLGRAGRARVETLFSAHQMVASVTALYDEALARSRR